MERKEGGFTFVVEVGGRSLLPGGLCLRSYVPNFPVTCLQQLAQLARTRILGYKQFMEDKSVVLYTRVNDCTCVHTGACVLRGAASSLSVLEEFGRSRLVVLFSISKQPLFSLVFQVIWPPLLATGEPFIKCLIYIPLRISLLAANRSFALCL